MGYFMNPRQGCSTPVSEFGQKSSVLPPLWPENQHISRFTLQGGNDISIIESQLGNCHCLIDAFYTEELLVMGYLDSLLHASPPLEDTCRVLFARG